jgi:hypothetical protein
MMRAKHVLSLAVASFWVMAVLADQQAPASGTPAAGQAPAEGARQGGAPAPAARGGRAGGRGAAEGAPARAGGGGGASTFGTGENAELIFEEKWTRAPMAQPMTQVNLGNQNLKLHLYGDIGGIRKTFHEIEDYTYTGETRNNWMITVSDPANLYDLTLPGKVMLRTRNTGFRLTHIVIKTTDGRYFVSEEGSGESRAWMNRDYIMADLHWRSLTMVDTLNNARRPAAPDRAVIVAAGVATPDLSKVDEIGFTDLMPGGFIPATTRINAWAVYGKKVAR